MYIYKLILNNPTKIRIGKTSWNDSDDFIHSDTLFSAIINCYSLLYGSEKIEDFINEFITEKIKISSLFYSIDYYNSNENDGKIKTINFLPKPFIQIKKFNGTNETEDNDNLNKKKIKKLKFVSLEVYKEILENFSSEDLISETDLFNNHKFISDEFCCNDNELIYSFKNSFKTKIIETKNEIDRRTGQVKVRISNNEEKGQLFNEIDLVISEIVEENLKIKPNLYFIAEINSDFKQQFDASVRLMCDEGLGGERSFGKGSFRDIEINDFNWTLNNKIAINLSLVNPAPDEFNELKENIISYDSIIRGGWAENDLPKKKVRMLKEGSVFKNKVFGRLVEVRNEHSLNRDYSEQVSIEDNSFMGIHPLGKSYKIYQNGKGFYL